MSSPLNGEFGSFSAQVDENFFLSKNSTSSLDDLKQPEIRGKHRKSKTDKLEVQPPTEEECWLLSYLNENVFEILGKHLTENVKTIQKLYILRDFGKDKTTKRELTVEEKYEIILPEVLWVRRYGFIMKNWEKTPSLEREIRDLLMAKEKT